MLVDAIFFQGRIGRLAYFLGGVAMLPVAAIVALAVAMTPMRPAALVATMVAFGIAFAWFSLSLYVRRIRDIGWDPFVVLVGAVAVNLGDIVLARLAPGLSVDGHRTSLGVLANGALWLALLFWPGRGDDAQDFRFG